VLILRICGQNSRIPFAFFAVWRFRVPPSEPLPFSGVLRLWQYKVQHTKPLAPTRRHPMKPPKKNIVIRFTLLCIVLSLMCMAAQAERLKVSEGWLEIIGPDRSPQGYCPLEHADV